MTERLSQKGNLKISYDVENDVLWMSNDNQAPRGFDIVKNQVIVFFGHDGTTPTAVMVFDAAELLAPAMGIPFQAAELEDSTGDNTIDDVADWKCQILEAMNIQYERESDTLQVGKDASGAGGNVNIAEGFAIAFEEVGVPVAMSLSAAAELLAPIFTSSQPSQAPRLI